MNKWFALFFQDYRLDHKVELMDEERAKKWNAEFTQQGIMNLRWKEISMSTGELMNIADEWMVENFGEDGLHLP